MVTHTHTHLNYKNIKTSLKIKKKKKNQSSNQTLHYFSQQLSLVDELHSVVRNSLTLSMMASCLMRSFLKSSLTSRTRTGSSLK